MAYLLLLNTWSVWCVLNYKNNLHASVIKNANAHFNQRPQVLRGHVHYHHFDQMQSHVLKPKELLCIILNISRVSTGSSPYKLNFLQFKPCNYNLHAF